MDVLLSSKCRCVTAGLWGGLGQVTSLSVPQFPVAVRSAALLGPSLQTGTGSWCVPAALPAPARGRPFACAGERNRTAPALTPREPSLAKCYRDFSFSDGKVVCFFCVYCYLAETPFLQRCIFSSQCICGAAVVAACCCLGSAGTGGAQQLGRHLPLQRVICGGRAAFQPGTDTTAQTNPQTERPEGSTRSIQPDLPGQVKASRFYLCCRQRNGNAALEGRLSRGTSASHSPAPGGDGGRAGGATLVPGCTEVQGSSGS